jgi:hypothetical protein
MPDAIDRHDQIVAAFDDSDAARHAVEELEKAGYDDARVGILIPGQVDREEAGRDFAAGLVGGGAAGAATGTIIAGLVSLVVPPAGPILAGGFIGAALVGVPIGTATGAMIGSVIGMEAAKTPDAAYEDELRQGRSFVVVRSPEDRDRARRIIEENGGRIRGA